MTRHCFQLAILTLSLCCAGASAGLYKCIQADGSTSYQQLPCAAEASAEQIAVDTAPPGGSDAADKGEDYSVEAQLKAMQKARDQDKDGERKAARDTPNDAAGAPEYDRARCAKHRAQVARWSKEAQRTYRTRKEKEYEARMLEYHQSLAERYCAGE